MVTRSTRGKPSRRALWKKYLLALAELLVPLVPRALLALLVRRESLVQWVLKVLLEQLVQWASQVLLVQLAQLET